MKICYNINKKSFIWPFKNLIMEVLIMGQWLRDEYIYWKDDIYRNRYLLYVVGMVGCLLLMIIGGLIYFIPC